MQRKELMCSIEYTHKFFVKISVVLLLTGYSQFVFLPGTASSQQIYASIKIFYDDLSPYGQWVNYPHYGYVWIPGAGPDFVPYSTNGHWVPTVDGWAWVSDYPWGWAPFHYGRWGYDLSFGWFWVPDDVWGPSWVIWREGNGYYGWVPMPPGITIGIAGTIPIERWIFVRDRDFMRPDIYRYTVRRENNITIIRNSSVINITHIDRNRHAKYYTGPDRNEVQRVTGRTIRPLAIGERNQAGQTLNDKELRIYRPRIRRYDGQGNRPAPSRITRIEDIKQKSEHGEIQQEQPRKEERTNVRRNEQIRRNTPQTINRGQEQGTQSRNENKSLQNREIRQEQPRKEEQPNVKENRQIQRGAPSDRSRDQGQKNQGKNENKSENSRKKESR
jgi:hypothetical protein